MGEGTPESEELRCRLALARMPGLGSRGALRLLKARGSACAALATRASGLADLGLRRDLATPLASPDWTGVQRDLDWLAGSGRCVLTIGGQRYPWRLATIPDPPPLLFVEGDPEAPGLAPDFCGGVPLGQRGWLRDRAGLRTRPRRGGAGRHQRARAWNRCGRAPRRARGRRPHRRSSRRGPGPPLPGPAPHPGRVNCTRRGGGVGVLDRHPSGSTHLSTTQSCHQRLVRRRPGGRSIGAQWRPHIGPARRRAGA